MRVANVDTIYHSLCWGGALALVVLQSLHGLSDAGLESGLIAEVGEDLVLGVSVKDHAHDAAGEVLLVDDDASVEVLSKLLLLLLGSGESVQHLLGDRRLESGLLVREWHGLSWVGVANRHLLLRGSGATESGEGCAQVNGDLLLSATLNVVGLVVVCVWPTGVRSVVLLLVLSSLVWILLRLVVAVLLVSAAATSLVAVLTVVLVVLLTALVVRSLLLVVVGALAVILVTPRLVLGVLLLIILVPASAIAYASVCALSLTASVIVSPATLVAASLPSIVALPTISLRVLS